MNSLLKVFVDILIYVKPMHFFFAPWKHIAVWNFIKIKIPPRVFFTFFKLYKWYQIGQSITWNIRFLVVINLFHVNIQF